MTLNVAAKEAAKMLTSWTSKLLNMFCVPKRPSLPAPKTTVTKLEISEPIPDEDDDKLPELPNEVFEPETKEKGSNTEQLTPTIIETHNV